MTAAEVIALLALGRAGISVRRVRDAAPGLAADAAEVIVNLLAISGSLHTASLNTVLEAAVRLAPAGFDVTLYRALRELPLYDRFLRQRRPMGVAPSSIHDKHRSVVETCSDAAFR